MVRQKGGISVLFLLLGVMLTSWSLSASTTPKKSIAQYDEVMEIISKEPSNIVRRLYADGVLALALDSSKTEAKELFLKALALDSLHGPSLYELAGLMMQSADSTALSYMLRAVATDTTNLEYKKRLGQIYVVNNEYDSALKIYQNLITQEPNNPINFHALSMLYAYTNMPYSALSIVDSAESRFGKIPEFTATKRRIYTSLKLYDRAEEEALAAIESAPSNPENYLILAELYATQRKDSLAEVAFDRAIDLDPTNPNILIAKSNFYRTIDNNYKFLTTVLNLIEYDKFSLKNKISIFNDYVLSPKLYKNYSHLITSIAAAIAIQHHDNFEAINLYASYLAITGKAEQAAEIYKNQLSIPSHREQACLAVVEIETMLNRTDSVNKYSLIAIENQPENISLYLLRSSALRHLKLLDEAEQTLVTAAKKAKEDSVKSIVYGSMGDLMQEKGSFKKAEKNYKRALRYDNSSAVILNNYAYMLAQQGQQLEKALEMSVRSNELEGSNPTYLDTHAWVLYKMGRYEEAKKIMLRAVSLDNRNNTELFIHYGDILYALGEEFMATIYWRRALEHGHNAKEIETRINQTKNKR